MNIPEGKRKETPAEKLKDAFEQLDSIGDGLVKKLQRVIKQPKKGK